MVLGPMRPRRPHTLLSFCAAIFILAFFWHFQDGVTRFRDDDARGILDNINLEQPQSNLKPSQAEVEPGKASPTSDATPIIPTPLAPPSLPSEYFHLSEGQQKCKQFFTPSYLEYIATHQLPYCETESPSAFDCFTAPRLSIPLTDYWGETDPLCVAQGVSFSPELAVQGSDFDIKEFSIQCKPRDIAKLRASSTAAGEKLKGFRDRPQDWGAYWGDTGLEPTLKAWDFRDDGAVTECTKDNNKDDWIMLMRRDSHDTHNLWHKLMEIIQARHSFDALRIAINPATGQPWLSEQDAENVQLVFDDDREEILEPLWEIVTGKKPLRLHALQAKCFGNVILPLPGSGSPFWSTLLDSDYPETCPKQTLLDTYVDRILKFYGVEPRPVRQIRQHPTITIVDRKTNRKWLSLPAYIEKLKEKYPKSTIQAVDFAAISIEEQLRLAESTDILVGHHGAAMSYLMFMTPGSTVLEILPSYFYQHGFRHIAAMRGIQYVAGKQLYQEEYELITEGKPLPELWPPPPPPPFNHWQSQEWIYVTEDEFIRLVDVAVQTQTNRLSSSDLRD